MTHFSQYCKTIFNNKNDDNPFKNYVDSYSVFLTSRKYPIDDIKNYRKKAIISNYLYNNINSNKEEILSQYNFNDDTYNILLTPSYINNENINNETIKETEDDIETHYKMINSKYEYYNNISNKNDTSNEYTDEYQSEYSMFDESDRFTTTYDDDEDYYDDYEYVVEEEYTSDEETDEEY